MTMGIQNNLHWAAFFVKNLQLLTVTVALLTMLLKVRSCRSFEPTQALKRFAFRLKVPIKHDVSVLTRSNWGPLFLVLFIYCIPSIMFCFLVSVFFSKGALLTIMCQTIPK